MSSEARIAKLIGIAALVREPARTLADLVGRAATIPRWRSVGRLRRGKTRVWATRTDIRVDHLAFALSCAREVLLPALLLHLAGLTLVTDGDLLFLLIFAFVLLFPGLAHGWDADHAGGK